MPNQPPLHDRQRPFPKRLRLCVSRVRHPARMRDKIGDISLSPKKVGISSGDLGTRPRRRHGRPARVETDSLRCSEFVFYRGTFLAHIQRPWKTLKLKNCDAAPPLSARQRLLEGSMGVPPVKAPSFAAPPGPDRSNEFSTTPNLTPRFVTMN